MPRNAQKSKPVKMMASAIRAHPAAFGFGPAVQGGKILWNSGIDQYSTGSHDSGALLAVTATKVPAQKAEIIAAFDASSGANENAQQCTDKGSGLKPRCNAHSLEQKLCGMFM